MITKSINGQNGGIDIENRTISGWVSKFEVDRDSELVFPTAFEKHLDVYLNTPGPLLLFHSHRSLPIGKVLEMKVYPNEGLWGKFYISKTALGNDVLCLIEEGCLSGFSAGFVPIVAEDNPPLTKIPHEALKTSMGKRVKRSFLEVELVEVSLLPIPSNRSSLIDRADKGMETAQLILKSFDYEPSDFELALEEWVVSKKSFWDESEHPRDDRGMFTFSSKPDSIIDPIRESNYYPSSRGPAMSTNRAANEANKKIEESNKKLDDISSKQDRMIAGVNRVSNHTSWSNWFVKYGLVAAGAIGFYMMIKHGQKVKIKGLDRNDEKVISILNILKKYLKKGEELGLTNTSEYKKTKKFCNSVDEVFSNIKESKGLSAFFIKEKGLSALFVSKNANEALRYVNGKFRNNTKVSGKDKPNEVAHEVEYDTTEKLKGLSYFFITKEMSAEQFEESEHPRGNDGRFVDKNQAGVAPSPDKGSWGGYRKYSGRLPKDPIQMKDKLTQKIKETNPNILDDELNKQIVDYAVANKKPDLAFAVTDPIGYQKQRDAELQEIMRDKYNKVSSKGKYISLDSPNDIYDAKNDIRKSVSKWKEDIAESKSVIDAWSTFRDQNSERDDRNRAKLILGVATIAATLGLTAMLMKKQSAAKAGFEILESLKTDPTRTLQQGKINISHIPSDDYLRILKVVEPPTIGAGHPSDARVWQEIYPTEIGRFHKLVNWALSPIIGKEKAALWGPKITGLKSSRWRLPRYTEINTGVGYNYIPDEGDVDKLFHLDLFRKAGKTSDLIIPNVENIAIANKWIPRFPKDTDILTEIPLKTILRKKDIGIKADLKNNRWIINNEQKFLQFIHEWKARFSKKTGDMISEGPLSKFINTPLKSVTDEVMGTKENMKEYSLRRASLPTKIDRTSKKEEQQAWDLMSSAYEEWRDKNSKLGKILSRRMLTFLIPTFGITGSAATSLYYFHKDISDVLDSSDSPENTLVKVMDVLNKTKTNKMNETDKQIQLEKARSKRIESELFKEAVRQNLVHDLIDELHARRSAEGAVTDKTLTETIIRKKFSQLLSDMNYSQTKSGISKLAKDLDNPEKRAEFIGKLDNIYDSEISAVHNIKNPPKETNKVEGGFETNADFLDRMAKSGESIDQRIEELNKTKKDNIGSKVKEFVLDILLKGFAEEQQNITSDNLSEDEVLNIVAYKLASMFADVSESCQMVIESGMPGESKYESINRFLEDLYVYMKDNAKENETEISEKSFDNSSIMSSTIDNSGGLLVGSNKKPKNQKCEVCGKIATEEVVKRCDKKECPNSFLETIEIKE